MWIERHIKHLRHTQHGKKYNFFDTLKHWVNKTNTKVSAQTMENLILKKKFLLIFAIAGHSIKLKVIDSVVHNEKTACITVK